MALPSFSCPCDAIVAPEAPKSALSLAPGLAFSKTPQYSKDFAEAVDAARAFVHKYKREHPEARQVAIVSDIDETLLDNREEFEQHPNFAWSDFGDWIQQGRDPNLKKTAALLKWARKNDVAILLVTGRFEKFRLPTIENLVHNQISYDALFMRPNDSTASATTYKSEVRKMLEEQGFKIIVNIGDQWSDLLGGHSIDCEKLPNRMYFIP